MAMGEPATRRASWGHTAGRVVLQATRRFAEDRCPHLAAGIAYFALLAFFPVTLLAASLAGILIGDAETQQTLLDWIVDALPVEAPAVERSLRAVAGGKPTLTLISGFATLWLAAALSAALRNSLDIVFRVRRRRPLVLRRLIDIALLPALGIAVLASIAVSTTIRIIRAEAGPGLLFGADLALLWQSGAIVIGVLLSSVTFAALYCLLPNRAARFSHSLVGASVAAIAFEAVNIGFATYVANLTNYNVLYGSLGGIVALLLWLYITANIMLFGAEIAAAVPLVLRHRRTTRGEGEWRNAAWALLRGLVRTPGTAHSGRPAKDPRDGSSATMPPAHHPSADDGPSERAL